MTASYPGAIKTFTTKVNGILNIIDCTDVNYLQDEVTAIETAFGASPIDGLALKATPAAGDEFVIYDSIASVLKKLTLTNLLTALQFPVQGGLVNGQIVTSVTSNNLTVALKNITGNDPSATYPVFVRIGNTVRAITSALSVTKNAGTNWCNLGSAELVSQDTDVFAYLGYNATDGVTLGFSRIPYARVYSDFSVTSTNEKYAAISTIAHAAASDVYELVGRCNVTLGASATYYWSIPGTSIIINRPIYDTRWLVWVPQYTTGSGTPTTITQTVVYQVSFNKVNTNCNITISNKGTAAGYMGVSLPFSDPASSGFGGFDVYGSDVWSVTGYTLGTNVLYIRKYDSTTEWITSANILINAGYRLV